MSELEKRLRDEYQKKRKKWIFIEMMVAAVLVLATVFTFIPYAILNSRTYVYYAEDGKAETNVLLADNAFYEEDYLGSDHAYVAALIDRVQTDFKYGLVMDAEDVTYKYSYVVDATMNVIDRESKAPLYSPSWELDKVENATATSQTLFINKPISIVYADYNRKAQEFVDAYGVQDATANLTVRMTISVLGESEQLVENKDDSYSMEVTIPLLRQTVKVTTQSTIPEGEQKILACDTVAKTVLLVLWIVFLCLSVLAIGFIVAFVILTRDKHIDYARRVQKLLSGYRSYIQRIGNPFDFEGYKVLHVMTFAELLEISDKLQNPVLMYENEDKTRSEFFIATANNLIYLYVVEVQDEDEEEPIAIEIPQEVASEEAAPVAEEVVEEAVEAVEAPVVEEAIEASGSVFGEGSKFKRSFMAKLIQGEAELQEYYSALKNELLSYEQVKARMSWHCESFNRGRVQLAKMTVRGKTLLLYLALTPSDFEESKYHHSDSSDSARYGAVPFTLKVRSARALKYAKELIAILMVANGLGQTADFRAVDYRMPYQTTKALIAEGLIKYDGDINELSDEAVGVPAEEPVVEEAPAEEAVEEEPVAEEAPAEEAVVEEPVVEEAPVEEPVAEEAEVLVGSDESVTGSDEPEAGSAEEVAEESVEEVAEEAADESVDVVLEEPVGEPEAEPVAEPVEEIVEEPVEEEVIEEPVQEEAAEEAAAEPIAEVVEEPVMIPVAEEPEAEAVIMVEAIDVKWNAKDRHTYRYDPNGEEVDEGDVVIVPTTVPNLGEVERAAQVARGNYQIDASELKKPLKKVIRVVKRKMQAMVASSSESAPENAKTSKWGR